MDTPKRYHPLLVTLHWLVAVLVSIELYIGLFMLGDDGPGFGAGRNVLAVHMATGIAILALVIVRFFVRIRSKKPADANAGNPFLNVVAKLTHYGLYAMLLVITVVGLAMAIQTRRLQTVLLGQQPQFAQAPGGFPPAGVTRPQGEFPRPGGEGFRREGFEGGFPLSGPFLLRGIHKLSAYIILLLAGLHVAAALYHQFLRRDRLLSRMWYGAT